MLFSSMLFLWAFLPLLLIVYFSVKKFVPDTNSDRKRLILNIILLTFSLVFYGAGGPIYLLLLSGVVVVDFFGGLFIEHKTGKERKRLLVLILFANLMVLFLFKYLNLFVLIYENLTFAFNDGSLSEAWTNMLMLQRTGKLSYADIVLPIGISFYIFQAISYVVDVYREKVTAQKSICEFALYVSLFPQLIAGPIVQYSDVNEQLKCRNENPELFSEGISRFIYGLAKKVIIANAMGSVADQIWELPTVGIGAAVAWLGAISYTLQIYFDFSGYSDMAIGLGKMFGFNFKENFNYPYVALSIQDFWRRWHISLSSWFREYVYIPLGGSRCSRAKLCRNIFLVFLLTGIWHGANFTFLIWGVVYAVLLILERLFLGNLLKKNPVKIINWLYTMFFVICNWIMFRSDNCIQGFQFIKELFSKGEGEYSVFSYLSMNTIIILIIGMVVSAPLYTKILKKKSGILQICFQMLLLLWSIVLLIAGTYNPFIYFQF